MGLEGWCGNSCNGHAEKLCANSYHGDRLTYLAVSSAGHIHVKDELPVILGAVGPWRAAGGGR